MTYTVHIHRKEENVKYKVSINISNQLLFLQLKPFEISILPSRISVKSRGYVEKCDDLIENY